MDIIEMFKKKKKQKIIEIFKEDEDNDYVYGNSIEYILRIYIYNNICTELGKKINGEYCYEGIVCQHHITEMTNELLEYRPKDEYMNKENIDIISEVILEEVIKNDIYNLTEYREIKNGIVVIGVFDPEMIPF